MDKIVMIGPVYPYKGGIAHYTGLMCRALRKEYDVHMMSYSMQYPRFLFKKEQKDFSNDTFKIEDTDYAIHTANPFNLIKVAKKIRKMKPDLVIIQWWHPYFAPCYWILCKLIGKSKVLFVCHNVFPHERFPMDRFLTKLVLKQGDYFVVHSSQDEEDLKSICKEPVYRKTVLPTYNAFKFQNMSKEEGRKQLQLSENTRTLLFFGFVREYKGLKHLLRAMPGIVSAIDNVKLLVVGDFAGDKEDYLNIIHELNVGDYIEIHDGYIPDKEVEKFFAASDLVVLPYESATQSAVVQVAYGFEKPVVVTNVGGLPEVVLNGKTGYVVEPFNHEMLGEAVVRFFAEERMNEFQQNVRCEADKYEWERMTDVINELTKN